VTTFEAPLYCWLLSPSLEPLWLIVEIFASGRPVHLSIPVCWWYILHCMDRCRTAHKSLYCAHNCFNTSVISLNYLEPKQHTHFRNGPAFKLIWTRVTRLENLSRADLPKLWRNFNPLRQLILVTALDDPAWCIRRALTSLVWFSTATAIIFLNISKYFSASYHQPSVYCYF